MCRFGQTLIQNSPLFSLTVSIPCLSLILLFVMSVPVELSVTAYFIIVITSSPYGSPIVPQAAQKGCLFPGEPRYSNMRQEGADGQRQVDTSKHCLMLSAHQTHSLPAHGRAGPTVVPASSRHARRDGCLQELRSAGSPA